MAGLGTGFGCCLSGGIIGGIIDVSNWGNKGSPSSVVSVGIKGLIGGINWWKLVGTAWGLNPRVLLLWWEVYRT